MHNLQHLFSFESFSLVNVKSCELHDAEVNGCCLDGLLWRRLWLKKRTAVAFNHPQIIG